MNKTILIEKNLILSKIRRISSKEFREYLTVGNKIKQVQSVHRQPKAKHEWHGTEISSGNPYLKILEWAKLFVFVFGSPMKKK